MVVFGGTWTGYAEWKGAGHAGWTWLVLPNGASMPNGLVLVLPNEASCVSAECSLALVNELEVIHVE